MNKSGIGNNDKSYSNNIYSLKEDKKSDVKKLEKLLEELERFGFGEITVQ
jgi:hypothetical protein